MKFRTELTDSPSPRFITHDRPLITLGSCFADNVAARLKAGMFDVVSNPFGTLFNPASVCSAVERMAARREFTADDIFAHLGRWHSFDAHSSLSTTGNETDALSRLNAAMENGAGALRSAAAAIITLGTAWVFRLTGTDRVVANCHKLPADRFTRTRLSVDECTESLMRTIAVMRSVNPDIKVILTVSPVRHLADGLHGNTLSKATLHLAVEQIVAADEDVWYFPAYELLCDDLRDYRFYAADMVHPSEVAVDYVYERFSETFLSREAVTAAKECAALSRRLAHRPMGDGEEATAFRESTATLHQQLKKKYPYLK